MRPPFAVTFCMTRLHWPAVGADLAGRPWFLQMSWLRPSSISDTWLLSLCPHHGVKLCTYHRWFSRPTGQACPTYWDVPIGIARLHRIFRFRMGSHLLPIEQGRHINLPRNRRVCRLCRTGALGDERHMLLECSALADLRQQYSTLIYIRLLRRHGQACVGKRPAPCQQVHYCMPR